MLHGVRAESQIRDSHRKEGAKAHTGEQLELLESSLGGRRRTAVEPSECLVCLSGRGCNRCDPSLTLSWLKVGTHYTQDIGAGINYMWFLE